MDDLMLSGNEQHAINQTQDETVVVNSLVIDNGEETQLVERLVGIVNGESITEPHGKITRKRERSDDPHINAERRLKPAGDVNKMELEEILPRRAEMMADRFTDDQGPVRDVNSF